MSSGPGCWRSSSNMRTSNTPLQVHPAVFFFTLYQMTTERLMLHYGHRLYLLRGEMHEIKKVGRFSVHPKVKDRYLASYYVIIYSSGLFRCELQSSGGIGRVCRLPNIMELRMTLKTHF